jgi:hypothetical protein
VILEQGALMHWIGSDGFIELDRDLPAPLAAFVPGGPLVLVSEPRSLLLDVDSRGVNRVTRMESGGQHPVGVSAAAEPGEFGILGAQGEMTVFRIPR